MFYHMHRHRQWRAFCEDLKEQQASVKSDFQKLVKKQRRREGMVWEMCLYMGIREAHSKFYATPNGNKLKKTPRISKMSQKRGNDWWTWMSRGFLAESKNLPWF